MNKRPPVQIEWHILDERVEERHDPAFSEVRPETPAVRRRLHRLYVVAGSALLLLLLAGGWLWLQAQTGIAQIDAELRRAAEAELWVAMQNEAERAGTIWTAPSAATWQGQFGRDDRALAALEAVAPDTRLAVSLAEIHGDRAVAQVTAPASGSATAYRQTRFYRRTAEGWLHTAPDAEWWGVPDYLESTFFVFEFRKKDANVVAEVAVQADAMYGRMRSDFGLALAPETGKPVVQVSPTELPGAALLRSGSSGRYVIPSPALYLAPATVSDAELVLQSLALLLSEAVVEEAVTRHGLFWVRAEMLSGLRLWALWQLDLPLAAWREEVVRWRVGGVQAGNSGEAALLPGRCPELCALHGLWLPSPALVSIPLTCTEVDRAPSYTSQQDTLSAAHLEQLAAGILWQESHPRGNSYRTAQPGDTVILATLVEYPVSSYGRERLPDLLTGLGQYSQYRSWAALSQAVYRIPPDQLAAGWQAYLLARYGVENGPGESR
ncbi:MAG TPA: hypothetical protein VGB35_04060 [Gammaproteobacteria bacterium]